MNNCSIHPVYTVQQLLNNPGTVSVSYSPDLNPVEAVFFHFKSYLKQHNNILDAFPNITSLVKQLLITPQGLDQTLKCFFFNCD